MYGTEEGMRSPDLASRGSAVLILRESNEPSSSHSLKKRKNWAQMILYMSVKVKYEFDIMGYRLARRCPMTPRFVWQNLRETFLCIFACSPSHWNLLKMVVPQAWNWPFLQISIARGKQIHKTLASNLIILQMMRLWGIVKLSCSPKHDDEIYSNCQCITGPYSGRQKFWFKCVFLSTEK